jgi:hypothetical protein
MTNAQNAPRYTVASYAGESFRLRDTSKPTEYTPKGTTFGPRFKTLAAAQAKADTLNAKEQA